MKSLIVLVLTFCFGFSFAADNQSANYKGYEAVNNHVFEKILAFSPEQNQISTYIGEYFYPYFASGLASLMGYYGSGGEMRNGEPNPMSVLVYTLVFGKIALQLAKHCKTIDDPQVTPLYQAAFLSQLKELCQTPVTQNLSDELYQEIWLNIIGYSATIEEFEDWKGFHAENAYANVSDRTYGIFLSLFLNPNFIIEN